MYVAEEMGVEIDEETGEVIDAGALDTDGGNGGGSALHRNNGGDRPITQAQRKKLIVEAQRVFGRERWREAAKSWMRAKFGKESSKELTRNEASELIEEFAKLPDFDGKSPIGSDRSVSEIDEFFGVQQ